MAVLITSHRLGRGYKIILRLTQLSLMFLIFISLDGYVLHQAPLFLPQGKMFSPQSSVVGVRERVTAECNAGKPVHGSKECSKGTLFFFLSYFFQLRFSKVNIIFE